MSLGRRFGAVDLCCWVFEITISGKHTEVSINGECPKWMVYNGQYWNGWSRGIPISGNLHMNWDTMEILIIIDLNNNKWMLSSTQGFHQGTMIFMM
jgi:hypothetical protein